MKNSEVINNILASEIVSEESPAKLRKRKRLNEAKEFASRIIDDPRYRKQLKVRAIAGTLPPGIETMLWYYRFGKPVDKVDLTFERVDYSHLTNQELAERARELLGMAEVLEGVVN